MQNILDVKMKMETQAKQEFSMAKNAVDEENMKLQQLYGRRKECEEHSKELLMGTLNILEIEANKNALHMIDEYIVLQVEQVKAAEKRLEQAQEALAEVIKDRKTHEILKERAFEEFLQEENRSESKAVDELTSYTYGQKRQVNN